MEAVKILDVFTNFLGNTKDITLVLQKTKKRALVGPFKEYAWIVWYINGNERYQLLVFVQTLREVTEAEETSNIEAMEKMLLEKLFDIVRDEKLFKSLRYGTFKGYSISPDQ